MNKYHQEILEEMDKSFEEYSLKAERSHFNLAKYLGTTRPIYNQSSAGVQKILKIWIKNNPHLSLDEFVELLNSLYLGETHNERTWGGKLLEFLPKLRKQINPQYLNRWLSGAEGWLEVDSLCQSSFTGKEMLDSWREWEKLLKNFVGDKDIAKRRASLVLLCKPVRESDDQRLADLAFTNIDNLKMEKDILITKAISWLLRDLIKNHKNRVEKYLQENKDCLPKIAFREATRKLLTGKK